MKSILDQDFPYTPAIKTDVRESFERERKRLQDIRAEHAKNEREACEKIAGQIKPLKARTA